MTITYCFHLSLLPIAVAHRCRLLLLPTDPRYGLLAMTMGGGDTRGRWVIVVDNGSKIGDSKVGDYFVDN